MEKKEPRGEGRGRNLLFTLGRGGRKNLRLLAERDRRSVVTNR